MIYLIYNKYEKAQSRCDKAYQDMHCSDHNTTAYAIPIKHNTEDLWAVCVDDLYKYLFTEEEINEAVELTEDWFHKFELI